MAIRFFGPAATRVREREWHESQELRERPDGEVDLELVLGALEEVEGWVLSWGAEAEVLRPWSCGEEWPGRWSGCAGVIRRTER